MIPPQQIPKVRWWSLKFCLYHVQLKCNPPNSQPTITKYLPYPLDCLLSPSFQRPPTPGVIFYLIVIFFKPLVPHKTRERDMVLSLYTYWSISRACDGVFSSRTKYFSFIRYSVLIVCSSVLIAERFEQVAVKWKVCEKMLLVAESCAHIYTRDTM